MNQVLSYVLWGFFGLLLLGIFFGVLWGAIRGWKRAAFRLGTLVLAIPLAILLAPVIANPLGGIRIGGYTISGLILGNMDGAMGTAAQEFTQLEAFLLALPIAIMSLLVFIVLLYFFRFLTWVIYAIFANKVAPRRQKVKTGERTANGMAKFEVRDAKPSGVSRLLGGLIGAGQGILLFFLLMIPINGILTMANEVTTYQPDFATADVRLLDEDVSPLANVFEEVVNFNDQVRRHPFGIAMRFTGMKVTSGPMFEYISTVRTPRGMQNVNLRRDAIQVANIYTDFVAIHQNFFDADGDTRDFAEVMESEAFAPYWNGMRGLVNRVFDISLFRLFVDATADFAEFIDNADLIDEDDLPEGLSLANILFDLGNMTSNSLRLDLLSIINLAQDAFTPDAITETTPWADISDLLDADDLIEAIADLGENSLEFVASILDTLTNNLGFSPSFRLFIAYIFEETLADADILGDRTEEVINELIEKLEDFDYRISWIYELRLIQEVVALANIFMGDNVDLTDLINAITNPDFMDAVTDSQILGPIVVAIVGDLVDDFVDEYLSDIISNIVLDSSSEGFAASLEIMSLVATTLNDILDDTIETGAELANAIGYATFTALAQIDSGDTHITLTPAVLADFESTLNTLFDNNIPAGLLGAGGLFRSA